MFSEMRRTLLAGAVFAPPADGGGGADDVAKAAADKAAADKVAADKTASDKAAADAKAAADKALGDAKAAGIEEGKKLSATAWRETITDDKLKTVADRYASPAEMAKGLIDLRTDLSGRVKPLAANATPEERANYNRVMEVPESAKGYFELPAVEEGKMAKIKIVVNGAEREVEISAEDRVIAESRINALHKAGTPKAVAVALIHNDLIANDDARKKVTEQLDAHYKAHDAILHKEWPGKEYDENMELARRTAEALGPDFLNMIDGVKVGNGMLGDYAPMARLLAAHGRLTAEGKIAVGTREEQIKSAQSELDDLNRKVPVFSAEYKTDAHQAKLRKLHEQLSGTQPIVGAGGRSV